MIGIELILSLLVCSLLLRTDIKFAKVNLKLSGVSLIGVFLRRLAPDLSLKPRKLRVKSVDGLLLLFDNLVFCSKLLGCRFTLTILG